MKPLIFNLTPLQLDLARTFFIALDLAYKLDLSPLAGENAGKKTFEAKTEVAFELLKLGMGRRE